jgi:hypothetical protein
MPAQHSSDAAIDILRVCRDGIRFQYFGQLQLPRYQRTPPSAALPALDVWVQAAAPPPARVDGTPWQQNMLRQDGEPWPQRQLAVVAKGGNGWQTHGVRWPDDTPALAAPPLAQTILCQQISVPFGWMLDVRFPANGEVDQVSFLSQPYEVDQEPLWGRRVGVNYFGTFTLRWTRDVAVDDWIAISFERFAENRRSVDYIAPVTPGNLFSPS